jgi:uncharacterized DUF497 family protein
MDFRWNAWNLDHIGRHGVAASEAERAVDLAKAPYPLRRQDDKWLVWGRGKGGRILQVVFILDDDGKVYVIHARPLTEGEKRRYRRRNQ